MKIFAYLVMLVIVLIYIEEKMTYRIHWGLVIGHWGLDIRHWWTTPKVLK